MPDSSPASIRLRGVRQNNLKEVHLDLPLRQCIVIVGLSGSGKSSLAFDTLFAEGQRRYIETFSPYARQFLDRMDKPQADSIEGIPPAIAIEQRNTVKSTRSTVGTMTEITDYAKTFWPHVARLNCRKCGEPVQKDSPAQIWRSLRTQFGEPEMLVTFDLALSDKFPIEESLALIARQGYRRLWAHGAVIAIEEAAARFKSSAMTSLTVVQDRIKMAEPNRARFVEACEQAYHFGKGKLNARPVASGAALAFSNRLHCAQCDIEYRDPSPALFSFNHPIGACPTCRGFGRVIAIDYNAAIPDGSKTLAGGAVKPWQTASNAECQDDLMRFARRRKAPVDVPFAQLPQKWRDWVIQGDVDYGKDKAHKWPRAWYGVKGYFRWLETKSYKMHVRVLLSRYRVYKICPDCHGARFQPESLLYRVAGRTIADFYGLTVKRALEFVETLAAQLKRAKKSDPIAMALGEVRSRLGYLDAAGLGYLTLDRPTRSLSGGETERVNLTACLGSRLVNTLFVLDEPSVGLHPRDTSRLVRIIRQLRDAGNTVVVVEHEASVMRAADQIVELGPGHGESGGEVVFQGTFQEILSASKSLTGDYLSGRRKIEIPRRRAVGGGPGGKLTLRHARLHNLKNLTVEIPLGRFVCVTGVSGSGKSTLITEVLGPAVAAKLEDTEAQGRLSKDRDEEDNKDARETSMHEAGTVEGWETLGRVVAVDQSLLGRTPRSNPAVYIGAFDDIRAFFAQTDAARQQGLGASAFSFNSAQGQCERCRGAGFEKIEMQFLSDIFIRCPECNGRRYRPHILEIVTCSGARKWSIADLLDASVDEAIDFLAGFPESRPASSAAQSLKVLQEAGLGYLRIGQPINTLSGGESQRLKLVKHLAHVRQHAGAPILFIFDEPTTGLHFDDVRVLLQVFQRLVEAGHSVLVIEHNVEVIKSADWIIDLGPEGGEEGGRIVAEGTPEEIAATKTSHTGAALTEVLQACH
ncbi:MAG TPA: excinuclease ABC subunit UvrA [Candidatus Baltobacteraceae bacterium]|jgi:excinuclease ABC subunit A|nr:excinuclease ABC subunit UvrA [Candidatus Baltobacteraceae bacterium]